MTGTPGPPDRSPRGCQGTAKGTRTGPIVRRTRPWEPLDDEAALRERLLQLVARRMEWPYWELRQAVGGRVNAARFRAAIDALIAEGRLVEVREPAGGRRTPRHRLIDAAQWPVIGPGAAFEVRGAAHVVGGVRLEGPSQRGAPLALDLPLLPRAPTG